MFYLYLLKFKSGKNYVGQTTRTMKVRFGQHRNSAMNGGSQLPVHLAWRKHGEPKVEILGEYDNIESLHKAEIGAIKELDTLSPNGYNLSLGGDTAPSKNPKVAAKIAKKAKGRKIDNTERRSEIATELWERPEYREKMSASLKEHWTDDKREATSKRMREMWAKRKSEGWEMPEETKKKLAARAVKEETKRKMSASAKKRERKPVSEATRKKLAENARKMWADPATRQKLMQNKKEALEKRHEALE